MRHARDLAQIRARHRGRAVEFELGSLHDWLGVEVTVGPDWGRAYDVVPDDAWLNEHDWARAVAERFARIHERGPAVTCSTVSKTSREE